MADNPQRFSTDEIVQVFTHLEKRPESWAVCMAEHGMEPDKVERALRCIFEWGDGRIAAATSAFVLGLQFGAMRLEPVAYDPETEEPCNCVLCQIRRTLESAGGGLPGDEDEDG